MLIGAWDISNANAKQWNVTPGNHSFNNDSDWVRGSPIPVLFKSKLGFKTIKITMMVYGNGRKEILANCSEILSHLLEPVKLKLDNFEHEFYGVMTKHNFDENPFNALKLKNNRASKLTIEFNCYEYADEIPVTASGATTVLVSNPGNILTPAIVEITPQIGAASITVTGICRDANTGEDLPVKISDLLTGKKIILNGETGLFTQEGNLKDIEIWEMPTLLPGDNRITVDNNRTDITVRFRPRFM